MQKKEYMLQQIDENSKSEEKWKEKYKAKKKKEKIWRKNGIGMIKVLFKQQQLSPGIRV